MACGERFLLGVVEKLGVRRAGVFALVLLLLDAQDVGGALDAGEQVLAVVAVEEFAERLDAAHDQQQVVLAFEREHGIDQIVPRALLAQLDLQAVGEEGKKIRLLVRHSIDAIRSTFDASSTSSIAFYVTIAAFRAAKLSESCYRCQ